MERHRANRMLQTPLPAHLPADERDLSADQPTAPLEQEVIDSAIEAMERGQTHYVGVPGIDPLREAIAEHLAAQGLPGYHGGVIVTAGVQEARCLSVQVLAAELGRVGLPRVVHPGARRALGLRPFETLQLEVDEGRGLLAPPNEIERVLGEGAKLVYLESPSRLTGARYHESEVVRIGELAAEHGAALLWDAGLAGWTPDHASLSALAGHSERITLLGELFPGSGLAGLALGFIATDANTAAAITSLKQIVSICTATAGQYAALKVAESYRERRQRFGAELAERRTALVERLQALGAETLPGSAASHVAVRAGVGLGGVTVANGADFGAPGVLRVTVPSGDGALELLAGARA